MKNERCHTGIGNLSLRGKTRSIRTNQSRGVRVCRFHPTGIGKLLKIIRIRLNSRSVIAFRLYCVVKRMPLWVFRHQRKRSTVFAFPSVEVWIAPDLKKAAPDAISDQNNPEIRESPETHPQRHLRTESSRLQAIVFPFRRPLCPWLNFISRHLNLIVSD